MLFRVDVYISAGWSGQHTHHRARDPDNVQVMIMT